MNGMLQSIVPIGLREICIKEHSVNLVKKSLVYALGDTIVLQGVGSC